MAGGMRRRGSPALGSSLAERVAGTPRRPDPDAAPPVKHCWVSGPDGQRPALLLGWRRGPAGWEGRVVHPVLEPAGWALVDEWLPAVRLGPA